LVIVIVDEAKFRMLESPLAQIPMTEIFPLLFLLAMLDDVAVSLAFNACELPRLQYMALYLQSTGAIGRYDQLIVSECAFVQVK